MEFTNNGIKKANDKKHALLDTRYVIFFLTEKSLTNLLFRIIINMSLDKLSKEKESNLKDIRETFDEVVSQVRLKEKQVIENLLAEYDILYNEYSRQLKEFEDKIAMIDDYQNNCKNLKSFNKIEFLTWYTSKSNIVPRLSSLEATEMVYSTKLSFDKDNELSSLSRIIHSKSAFDNLKKKNRELLSTNSVSVAIGRNYKGNNLKSSMSKCYSMNTLEDEDSKEKKLAVVGFNSKNGKLANTPCKKLYKSNIVDPKCRTNRSSNKVNIEPLNMKKQKKKGKFIFTNLNETLNLKINLDQTVTQGDVLSFLRKNSKIKGSKLKCAQRTQIDLKALNDPSDIDELYFSDSLGKQKSPTVVSKCESAYDNYSTEPQQVTLNIFSDNGRTYSLSLEPKSQSLSRRINNGQSSSPRRQTSQAINFNQLKKSNDDRIRNSLINFERTFKNICGSGGKRLHCFDFK